jgi:hypothetical protein
LIARVKDYRPKEARGIDQNHFFSEFTQ